VLESEPTWAAVGPRVAHREPANQRLGRRWPAGVKGQPSGHRTVEVPDGGVTGAQPRIPGRGGQQPGQGHRFGVQHGPQQLIWDRPAEHAQRPQAPVPATLQRQLPRPSPPGAGDACRTQVALGSQFASTAAHQPVLGPLGSGDLGGDRERAVPVQPLAVPPAQGPGAGLLNHRRWRPGGPGRAPRARRHPPGGWRLGPPPDHRQVKVGAAAGVAVAQPRRRSQARQGAHQRGRRQAGDRFQPAARGVIEPPVSPSAQLPWDGAALSDPAEQVPGWNAVGVGEPGDVGDEQFPCRRSQDDRKLVCGSLPGSHRNLPEPGHRVARGRCGWRGCRSTGRRAAGSGRARRWRRGLRRPAAAASAPGGPPRPPARRAGCARRTRRG
jgi:hypothetical protein